MSDISKLIKNISKLNTPSRDYFEGFLPAYKAYHKKQTLKRSCVWIGSLITLCLAIYLLTK